LGNNRKLIFGNGIKVKIEATMSKIWLILLAVSISYSTLGNEMINAQDRELERMHRVEQWREKQRQEQQKLQKQLNLVSKERSRQRQTLLEEQSRIRQCLEYKVQIINNINQLKKDVCHFHKRCNGDSSLVGRGQFKELKQRVEYLGKGPPSSCHLQEKTNHYLKRFRKDILQEFSDYRFETGVPLCNG
jgi:alpha-galactosidase/6-phospho-beta-glucosidase family protein